MGVRGALARLASGSPAPVFAAVGQGAREAVEELRLDARLHLVDSPRHASVLLLAGCFPGPLLRPALRVHDQMPRPRATVWWPAEAPAGRLRDAFPDAMVVGAEDDVAAALLRAHAALLRGERASEPARQPDVPPHPWRGVGPHGQGGKGMTGGFPYGRPLAKRAPARDGLELDQVPLRIGPFFPPFPPGLVLEAKLQGDVVQEVAVGGNPSRYAPVAQAGSPDARLFAAALTGPVPIATLEMARARHHLRWLAHMLRVHGLDALGLRALRLARTLRPEDAGAIEGLRRLLKRTRALGWATAGVGHIAPERLAGTGTGPVVRAAGLAEDARTEDPAYRALGFEPVVHEDGDARARWRQRLAEAVQALALASRAGEQETEPVGRIEAPRGVWTTERRPTGALLALLPSLLAGLEWGDAVATVVSLDLDLEEAAEAPAREVAA